MIGHVSPLDLLTQGMNAPGPLNSPSLARTNYSAAGASPPISSLAGAISGLEINAAVSQLLQSVGGGLETNKTLQMLIALLILVTLLQGSRDGGSTAGDLDSLARRGTGGYLGIAMSSTTITVEQTSILYTASMAQSSAGTEDAESGRGGRLDLAA